ncbi:MAG: DNA repair protein RecN [Oscillospiraceae bacterium]|nr:DNA repair protein RecN [Oscillospiraceae bacterium]
MLRELDIENVAVIEKANVRFYEGLNVLTGETGAGKSILIDSINAILGNRTTKDIVRSGTQKSVIFASFDDVPEAAAEAMRENGYDCDGELILQREITADGKSSCRINGRPATASTVRELCQDLVNIHGQMDNQELLRPEMHIHVLDRYAEDHELLNAYSDLFRELMEVKKEIEKLSTDDADKEARMDLLRYHIDEISRAELEEYEEEELQKRRNLIKNSEKYLDALNEAYTVLNGSESDSSEGAISRLYSAVSTLEHIQGLSEDMDSCSTKLSNVYYELTEISSEIGDQLSRFDFDVNELNSIEDRLDQIFRLKRKYGNSIPEILDYLVSAQEELESIETSDERLAQLRVRFDELKGRTVKAARELSAERKAAFLRFEAQIKSELEFLNMPNVDFVVNWQQARELTATGLDIVEFYISANAGEDPRPLARIASGGELSRIMLAIKSVMADKDAIPTLIFDEIDTGVSGTGSQRIGSKLRQTSRDHQIICVTHSAQVAAYAHAQLKIEKSVSDGRTYTSVRTLDKEERVREIARIISGENITDTALRNASEMLEIAQNT